MSIDAYLLYGTDSDVVIYHAFVPIEITKDSFGFLLGNNLENNSLEDVLYVRKGKVIRTKELSKVSLTKRDGLSVIEEGGRILPLPSSKPYRVFALSLQDYIVLRADLSGIGEDQEHGILEAVGLCEYIGFHSRKPFFRSKRIVPRKGYADQYIAYSGMTAGEDDLDDYRRDRASSRSSGFLERRR
jgi:hypothetical protein